MESLNKIEVASAKKHSTYSLWACNNSLNEIALLILKEKLSTIKEGYTSEVLNVIEAMKVAYLIIARYAFETDWHVPITSQIVDSITSIGAFAIDFAEEITKECNSTLNEIAFAMIKHDKYGYDIPRIAARIGVIGSVALHKNKTAIADEATTLLASLSKKYIDDSPKPNENRITEEIKRLREYCNEEHLGVKESEVYCNMYKVVEPKTIDALIESYEKKKK